MESSWICMLYIGKINRRLFETITLDLRTDEVVLSDTQIKHVKSHHPGSFEAYVGYLTEIIQAPDYILEANKSNTALILKAFHINGKYFKLVLRLQTSNDPSHYKNSIITFMKIDDKEWSRLLRNKKILYNSNENR